MTATEVVDGALEPFEANQNGGRLDDFGLVISADRQYTSAGEPVRIRFTVVNTGDDEEIREAGEGPVMDILVRYWSGVTNRIWWSEGREITLEMRRLELAPGESKTIEMTWIPPDILYTEFVHLYGVFTEQYHDTEIWTYLCVEGGCAGE